MTGSSRRACVGAGLAILAPRPPSSGGPLGNSRLPSLLSKSLTGPLVEKGREATQDASSSTTTSERDLAPPARRASSSVGVQGRPPRAIRTLQAPESIESDYELTECVTETESGTVIRKAVRKCDGRAFVVKTQSKRHLGRSLREWRGVMGRVLAMADAPYVLDIEEILEDAENIHMVMLPYEGGDLWNLLRTVQEPLLESEIKTIIRQILRGLEHLHKHQLIHQDIKPDNIMLEVPRDPTSPSVPPVRIIDFDLCTLWVAGKGRTPEFCGTPGFIAPEVFLGAASPQSDLWSVGAVLYFLITGECLWPDIAAMTGCLMDSENCEAGTPGAHRIFNMMRARRIDWDAHPWPTFHLARDLCQKLLEFDTKARPWSAAQALRHRWMDFPIEDRSVPCRRLPSFD